MKRFLSVIISIVMILALSVNAMAVDTAITITGDTTTRDYKAFMLLEASVSGTNFAYKVNEKYMDILVDELGLDAATATSEKIVDAISRLTAADDMARAALITACHIAILFFLLASLSSRSFFSLSFNSCKSLLFSFSRSFSSNLLYCISTPPYKFPVRLNI